MLIIGKRYGSIHPDTGISYTEMEYDYAISKGIPVLVFAIDNSVVDENNEMDAQRSQQLRSFREKAMGNRLVSIWKSADDLTGKVAIAIMKAKAEISRPGWQRGEDYDEASFRRETMTLQDENKQLSELLSQKEKDLAEFTEQQNLAFEDCTIEIPYSYDCHDNSRNSIRDAKLKTDLKTVFIAIATDMMGVSLTEYSIKLTILRTLPFRDSVIDIKDKQLIKRLLNQYSALFLMNSKWSEQSNQPCWYLTKRGKRVRDDVILIRKDNKP